MSVESLRGNLAELNAYLENLEKAKRGGVRVGLPQEDVGGEVYPNGASIIEVGAAHEYGFGVPQRSFLRLPFNVNAQAMNDAIAAKFQEVHEDGLDAGKALGQIGAIATNYVKDSFTTGGFGQWQDISEATKEAKGSSQILIDRGILRASISWVVDA